MKRTYFAVLGSILLASLLLMALAADVSAADETTLVAVGALLLTAVLLIVGGLTDGISIGSATVRWFQPVGCAIVLLGATQLGFAIERVGSGGSASVGAVAFAATGLVIAFIGGDFLRGGVHHDLSTFD